MYTAPSSQLIFLKAKILSSFFEKPLHPTATLAL
jgi:hypothetical protein